MLKRKRYIVEPRVIPWVIIWCVEVSGYTCKDKVILLIKDSRLLKIIDVTPMSSHSWRYIYIIYIYIYILTSLEWLYIRCRKYTGSKALDLPIQKYSFMLIIIIGVDIASNLWRDGSVDTTRIILYLDLLCAF